MTQPDYDQKKRECFVKFCKDNGIDQEVNISIFDAFDQIFDRAYALGKKFGISDFSDAEGEEMLTVSRNNVMAYYRDAQEDEEEFHPAVENACNIMYQRAVGRRQMLKRLFGSKCLPDELNEDNFANKKPQPAEPKNEGAHQEQCVPQNAESGTHSLNRILKDGFREHNRLHIAAMAMQGILSNADRMNKYEYVATEPPCAELAVVVARNALRYADALISECKKGGGNA